MKKRLGLIISILALAGVAMMTNVQDVEAADHLDPAGRVSAGQAADIGDLYAWHADGRIKTILTFAGPVAPGTDAAYSRDVLYGIHIDGNDADLEPDRTIWVRFAQNDADEWGVWLQNVPGAGDVSGATGVNIDRGGAEVFAGQVEDPFFFDLEGFQQTVMNAGAANAATAPTLAFNPDRDFFAGKNINAVAVEFDEADLGFSGPYQIWATSSMIGGGS